MNEYERKLLIRMCRLCEYIGLSKKKLSNCLDNNKLDEFNDCVKDIEHEFKHYYRSVCALKGETIRNFVKEETENIFKNVFNSDLDE